MTDSLVRRARVRAPELTGRRWLGTGGRSLSMAGLRGRIVVLDFWTFCCVNCLHVLEELRPLERAYADSTVFIGVHSPKFEHEGEPAAVEAAVERYAVHHPVLDDPTLSTWRAYTARAWPTLVVVDPEGYVVATMSGEGHGPGLAALLDDLVEEHTAKGTLRPGGDLSAPEPSDERTPLRFPGSVAALGDGSYLVSDTAHGQVVQLEPDLERERRRFGDTSVLTAPQGLLVLPEEVAKRLGYDVLVADATAHRILGLRLGDGSLVPVAGTGEQLRERTGSGPALRQPLSTPWGLAWFDGRVVVAMAGVHQLWWLDLAADPAQSTTAVLAGTSEEGLRDGPAETAWLAQPSGLATSADGTRLWVADSETSALRSVTRDGARGYRVRTHVGQGLFDFGHVDGPAARALMQHPLGVAVLPDGSVAVADTYNGAVRRVDTASGSVGTLATGLAEPSDAAVETDPAGGCALVVVESAAHRLVRIAVDGRGQVVGGAAHRTERPPTPLPPGRVRLTIAFVPPQGQKLDDRYGDPTRLQVSASPEGLLRAGSGSAPGLTRELDLAASAGSGILHVSVQAAACDVAAEHPACSLYQQDWGIPVVVDPGAAPELALDLRGV